MRYIIPMIDIQDVRKDFPFFKNNNVVYLDSAATSLTPESVITAQGDYYRKAGVNVNRGSYSLSFEAGNLLEQVREQVREFCRARDYEIIFTENTTSAINLMARGWAEKRLKASSNIVITELEHHANYLPWMHICKQTGAELRVIPLKNNEIDLSSPEDFIDDNTLLVSVTAMSNVTGGITPLEKLKALCKNKGARLFLDGAQYTAHYNPDLSLWGADCFVFSAHKILGPFGLGILVADRKLLEETEPLFWGGNMAVYLKGTQEVLLKDLPHRLEAGTQNPAAIAGFSEALLYLKKLPDGWRVEREKELWSYALKGLKAIEGITLCTPLNQPSGGLVTFNLPGVHPHDAASLYEEEGILLRTGKLCASSFFNAMKLAGGIRASFSFYNTIDEIDHFLKTTKSIKEFFA